MILKINVCELCGEPVYSKVKHMAAVVVHINCLKELFVDSVVRKTAQALNPARVIEEKRNE
jgi:hypothetical protein